MRKPFIAGNWKMHKTASESVELVKGLVETLKDQTDVKVAVCPTFVNLAPVAEIIKDTNIHLGAQNLYWEEQGAFTGEISAPMIKAIGCDHVIIGHSERRQYFNETNETVAKRIDAAHKHGLITIVCIGETLENRESGKTEKVLLDQIEGGLKHLSPEAMANVVIAYEPVWAIGTGKTATPDMANDAHKFIRSTLSNLFNQEVADNTIIQYGGSVKPGNVKDLMVMPDIDGALVGGAALKVEDFTKLVLYKEN